LIPLASDQNVTQYASCRKIKESSKKLKVGQKAYYYVTGFLHNISEKLWYQSCSNQYCRKKVKKQGDGQYFCHGCKTVQKNVHVRYAMKIQISDITGSL